MAHYGRAWAEVDLDAVLFNVEAIKKTIHGSAKIIAVIKTDGYGHGAAPIARLLEHDERIWGYAVATAEEAVALRREGMRKNIMILGYTFPYSYEGLIREGIHQTVFLYDTAKMLSEKAQELGKVCSIHIKVDTGMARIGVSPDEEGIAFIREAAKLPALKIEGIFTHFATADEADMTKARRQLQQFRDFVKKAERQTGVHIPLRHCANSAGIVQLPEAHMDAVRAGIILYGLYPSKEVKASGRIQLKPALSLKSRIIYLKTVPANQEISYGGTFTTNRNTRVATICIGYGDGYPRSLSNIGHVLVNGQHAKILGRVCMDQLMADVTDVTGGLCVGDAVTLIGADGDSRITMDELGELSGRFNYELACDLGKRVPRVYSVAPFYSASNMRFLEKVARDVAGG